MHLISRARTRAFALLTAAAAVLALGATVPVAAHAAAPTYSSFVIQQGGAPVTGATISAVTTDERFLAYAGFDASGFASFAGQAELSSPTSAILTLSVMVGSNSSTSWWNGSRFSTNRAAAQAVTVVAEGGETLTSAVVEAPGGITGKVSANGGPGVNGFNVQIFSGNGRNWVRNVRAATDGAYTVAGLDDGDYLIQFSADAVWTPEFPIGYFWTWYDRKPTVESAQAVTVTGGRLTTGVDQTLQPGAIVSGNVYDLTSDGRIPSLLKDAAVSLYPVGSAPDAPDALQAYAYPDYEGRYTVTAPPGTYQVAFGSLATGFGTAGFTPHQYWYRTGNEDAAETIELGPADQLSGIDGVFSEPVSRVAGFDRFQTSARLSQESFAPGAPVVYITNGLNFPDALSAAPVAYAQDGPVLLVAPDFIPDSVYAELNRLHPERIVILGSTTSVSAGVEGTLNELTEGTVTRIAGADRFVTSAKLSASQYEPDAPVAYVANGLNFPDALAASAVAGPTGGPILLVTPTSIPDAVADELDRLNPEQIIVLGGTPSVSAGVATQLKGFTTGKVHRFAGSDRFDTSAKISADSFDPGVPVVYVANGLNFPDALAAAAVAGREGGPILLVAPDFIPGSVAAELERLEPGRIVILGGDGNVSAKVAAELSGYLGS